MLRFRIATVSFAVLAIASVSAAQQAGDQAPKIFTLSGEMLRGYQSVQRNLAEAAEKMPAEHYLFKPTPDIKPFGQLVAHAALSQFSTCSMLKGEPSPRKDEKEERYHRVERSYGAFTRGVRLPVGVDGSKVLATFKNGLLTVTLPKTPAAKGTTIPIKTE